MLITIGYDFDGQWHQEDLTVGLPDPLAELHYMLNIWHPAVTPHVEWLHVFIRNDDRAYSTHTAIMGASTDSSKK